MPNINKILSESYQYVIHEYFKRQKEDILAKWREMSPKQQEKALAQSMNQYTLDREEIIREWSHTPQDALEGKTPEEVITDISDFKEVFELFLCMANQTDEEIPPILIRKLKSFGQKTVLQLYQIAKRDNQGNEEPACEYTAAVSALGTIGGNECIELLIQLAYTVHHSESRLEILEQTLKGMGIHVIEPILNRLEEDKVGKVQEMLLYVLASVATPEDERVYRKLRNAFRTMENKTHAVICFSVFGDGKAIPMLRSFLEKNVDHIPRSLVYEVIGAIRELGGDTKDLIKSDYIKN